MKKMTRATNFLFFTFDYNENYYMTKTKINKKKKENNEDKTNMELYLDLCQQNFIFFNYLILHLIFLQCNDDHEEE